MNNTEGLKRFLHLVEDQGIAVGDPVIPIGNDYMSLERGDFRLSRQMQLDVVALANSVDKQARGVGL
jgi:hypothetical protein